MRNKRLLGAWFGAVAMVFGLLAAVTPGATALGPQQWHLWDHDDPTSTGEIVEHDEVTGSATLHFYTELNFTPVLIECRIEAGEFTHEMTAANVLPLNPNQSREIEITPPLVVSDTTNGQCRQVTATTPWANGVKLEVTTDGMPWTLEVTAPPAPANPNVQDLFGDVLPADAVLTVPPDGIYFYDPTTNCDAIGPDANPAPVTGTYNTSTGVVTPDPAVQGFAARGVGQGTRDLCFVDNTELRAGSIVNLAPVLDLMWIP